MHGKSSLADHHLCKVDEDARLVGRDRHVEHLGEHLAVQMGQPSCPIDLFRLQVAVARRRAAAPRIAFDQRDEAIIGQFLVFDAQAPARHCVAIHARAQALVQQDAAGIEADATYQASVLFQRNV